MRVWNVIPRCLMRHIWRERNKRTFENQEVSIMGIQSQLLDPYSFGCLWTQVDPLCFMTLLKLFFINMIFH